jgi:uncharacterized iron-regulated protein
MRLVIIAAAFALVVAATFSRAESRPVACGQPGQWLTPGKAAAPIDRVALLERMATQQVVLLGESHDSAEDHRWQWQVLAQLHGRRPQLALGLEMFPRRLQPVLDQWIAGSFSEQEFLQKSEWDKVWGYEAREYLPLFHFARMNRIPMLALNVERSLPEAVGKVGWDAMPAAQKEGVSRPAAPAADYLKLLRKIYDHHPAAEREGSDFARFVEAQTLWDRAMAEAIADHLRKVPDALVIGILGAGHVRHGHGVPFQLKSLGIARVANLLTWSQAAGCGELTNGMADAVYVVQEQRSNPPRLGVATETVANGLRITAITAGSVAESAGLKVGDVILEVAAKPAKNVQVLRNVVQRTVPGTWLPLKIRRASDEMDIVARFPVVP